jgi:hypothetical protein
MADSFLGIAAEAEAGQRKTASRAVGVKNEHTTTPS